VLTGVASTTVIRPAEPGDIGVLLAMFGELARYEQLSDQLRATEQALSSALFGERAVPRALLAERSSEAAGYALFFPTFSTFLAREGVWLEDLFVRPSHRKAGVGTALLAAVAARAAAQGGRLEWAALDWNELALGFYRRLGARTMGEWVTHRLDGDALSRLAEQAVGPAASATQRRR
jgi:GNAT superfamily N-acetyltransferase